MSYPHLFHTPGVAQFAADVDAERGRQLARWGDQRHPDGTGPDGTWMGMSFAESAKAIRCAVDDLASRGETPWAGILLEEVFEALAESDRPRLRAELVQVAAVCAAWISDLDRRPVATADRDDTEQARPAETCAHCGEPITGDGIREWTGPAGNPRRSWHADRDACWVAANVARGMCSCGLTGRLITVDPHTGGHWHAEPEQPDQPEQNADLATRLRLAHQARRAAEHQLDGIRRALCDVGALEDGDPYGHADLADVIRQVWGDDPQAGAVAVQRARVAELQREMDGRARVQERSNALTERIDRENDDLRARVADTEQGIAAAVRQRKDAEDRAFRAEARRDELGAVLDIVLRQFHQEGHPGEPCLSSGWVAVRTVEKWRAVLAGRPPVLAGPPTPATAPQTPPSPPEPTDA